MTLAWLAFGGVVVVLGVSAAVAFRGVLVAKDERPVGEPVRRAVRSAGLELIGELRTPGWLEGASRLASDSWWTADGSRVKGPAAVDRSRHGSHGHRADGVIRAATVRDRVGGDHEVWVWIGLSGDSVEQVAFGTPLGHLGD